MVLPDCFIDHNSQPKQIAEAGLAARDIVEAAIAAIGMPRLRPKTATLG